MNPVIVVAIDGPAGVGKTATSRQVAKELGIPHIDTGAMYRAIALAAARQGVGVDAAEELAALARKSRIELRQDAETLRISLDGEDVTDQIRHPDISMAASAVSAVPDVRRILVSLQQDIGRTAGGVMEGRDIGTKVFPETPHKFFLTARPEVRAGRRRRELAAKGLDQPLETVMAEMLRRDEQDSTRADSPLTYDDSYRVIDTSDLTIDEVVAAIVSEARKKAR